MIKKLFKYLNRTMALFGFMTFLTIVVLGWKLLSFIDLVKQVEPISDNTILTLEVGGVPMNEINFHQSVYNQIRGYNTQSLLEIIDALDRAAKDHRIKGVFVSLEGNDLSLSNAYELRMALQKVKDAGKIIHSFGYSFCESTNGTTNYYLASIGHKISMQPAAMFNLNGLAAESYFLKGLLDDLQVTVQADGREEYKGVIESYTRKEFSDPVRQNMKRLLDTILSHVHANIAKGLDKPLEDISNAVATSPHNDTYPLKNGLITNLSYKDDAKEALRKELVQKHGLHNSDEETKNKEELDVIRDREKMSFVSIKSYIDQLPESTSSEKIAVIVIDGDVVAPGKTSESIYNPFSPENIDKSFAAVTKDKNVKAVVFRINSRGGAASGAEAMWHAVQRTVDKGIPVVVSMGSVAASAGYYMAAPANKIYALPITITGSIGVAFAKPNFRKASEKYGITWDAIEAGVGGRTWSLFDDFTPEVWERIQKNTDHTYDIFMTRVAEGRKLPKEEVHAVAKGQVWCGLDAKDHKLVDELGGFLEALDAAKTLGKVKDADPVLVVYNRQATSVVNLLSLLEMDSLEQLVLRLKTKFLHTGMIARMEG